MADEPELSPMEDEMFDALVDSPGASGSDQREATHAGSYPDEGKEDEVKRPRRPRKKKFLTGYTTSRHKCLTHFPKTRIATSATRVEQTERI